MSLDLIPVRLWWESHPQQPQGGRGEARYYALECCLVARPECFGFWAIQFSPGICTIVQELASPWRDMTRDERLMAMTWLKALDQPKRTP